VSHTWPDHLLSLAEWNELPQDASHRLELVEGVLLVVPRPTALHQLVVPELCVLINRQLPRELRAVVDLEVVVRPDRGPRERATVRAPDIVVLPTERVLAGAARVDAAEVRLAVEIHSPGTVVTDKVTKMFEYADAGIPGYWRVDIDPPMTVTAHVLVDGEYKVTADTDGRLDVLTPLALSLDVRTLTGL
jgi:Uma2 family endonuclease